MTDEELKQIIKENKQLLEDIDKRMHRIEKKFVWNTIFGFIKVVVIFAPIILGVIYFTPFLKDFFEIYKPVYEALPSMFQKIGNSADDVNVITGEADLMINSLCDPQTRQGMIEQLCK